MKILFITDLHGRQWKYGKLLELAKHHGVKVLANGGDRRSLFLAIRSAAKTVRVQ